MNLYYFKIILIGDNNVGKSWMMHRYTNRSLPGSIWATVGVNFCYHTLRLEPEVKVKLQILDTAGHKRFWLMTRTHFPQSAGCLLVFDLGDRESFNLIRRRYSEVYTSVNPYTVLFVLVGHKCDREEREVSDEEAEKFASNLGAPYIEASSKTGHNVSEAFELLVRRIYEGFLSGDVHLHEDWGKVRDVKKQPIKWNQTKFGLRRKGKD